MSPKKKSKKVTTKKKKTEDLNKKYITTSTILEELKAEEQKKKNLSPPPSSHSELIDTFVDEITHEESIYIEGIESSSQSSILSPIKREDDSVSPRSHTQLDNPIDEYFVRQDGNADALVSKELFKANSESIDIKTELIQEEIMIFNNMFYNDFLLKQKGLKPVFQHMIHKYMRLKISLNRKSRGEFVDMNKKNHAEDTYNQFSSLSNFAQLKTRKS